MDKTLTIAIDHLSILNFKLKTSADVFFSLGFVREGGRNSLDRQVEEQLTPTSRFIFKNAYIECVQFPPYIEEFYNYLTTPAGIHIVALLTANAEKTLQTLRREGMEIEDLDRVIRKNLDCGAKKGTVTMLLVPIPQEIIPRTHVAFLEHLTHDLLYQQSPYLHPNGVTELLGTTICCRDNAEADRIESQLTKLCALAENQSCLGGARCVRLVDEATLWREYGVHRSDGSAFSVLSFGAASFEPLRPFLASSGYSYAEYPDRLIVNLQEPLGLAFEFRRIRAQ